MINSFKDGKVEYTCDCCGKKAVVDLDHQQGEFVTAYSFCEKSKSWNDFDEYHINHYCRECFQMAQAFMRRYRKGDR